MKPCESGVLIYSVSVDIRIPVIDIGILNLHYKNLRRVFCIFNQSNNRKIFSFIIGSRAELIVTSFLLIRLLEIVTIL